jgi:hypothetical protein
LRALSPSLLLVVLLLSSGARAEEPVDAFRPKLVDLTPADRLDVLNRQLDLEVREAKLWYFGWGIAWSTIAVGQAASWVITAKEDRPSYWAWTLSTFVGAAAGWVLRPEVFSIAPELEQVRHDATLSDEQRLLVTERLWVRAHDDEITNRAWWQQLICIGTNVVPFAILGAGWHRWDWLYLGLGVATSELQIFSFPQLLRRFGVEPRVIRAL